jgi:hypothetical protein
MRTLLLYTCALLAGASAVGGAYAQINVGGTSANIPTPQGTIATTSPNVSGAASSVSAGNYGPLNFGPGSVGPGSFGPGSVGPGSFGPGAYGPGNFGPGAFSGTARPAAMGVTDVESR